MVQTNFYCECNIGTCNEVVSEYEFLELSEQRKTNDYYITLKAHVPEGNVIIAETENLVLRMYKQGD